MVVRIGALRVLKLGLPQPKSSAFHDQQMVTPLGFTSRRRFFDVLDATARTEYVCEVSELGGMPLFSITHERDKSVCFKGRTPVEAWSLLINRRHRLLHTRAQRGRGGSAGCRRDKMCATASPPPPLRPLRLPSQPHLFRPLSCRDRAGRALRSSRRWR